MATKVSIIGAGNVGSSIAYFLLIKEICDEIFLLDLNEDLAFGKTLDLKHTATLIGSKTSIKLAKTYEELEDSDIVVITAGFARSKEMTRRDLLFKNANIIKDISEKLKKLLKKPIIITVTNPIEAMTYIVLKTTDFESSKVMGMAGLLDSARMATLISDELNEHHSKIKACVLGQHNEKMLTMARYSFLKDQNVSKLLNQEKINEIYKKTLNSGADIVKSMKTSAYFAPAAGVCKMIESILKDKKEQIICSVLLKQEYENISGICGVPVILGKNGVEKIINLKLDETEKKVLKDGAEEFCQTINSLGYDKV